MESGTRGSGAIEPVWYQVRSGGARLCAVSVGRRGSPAVVLLHAGVGDRRMWADQLQALGRDGYAVAWDRRGFGDTRPPGRVGGAARRLFLDMNGRALRAEPLTRERKPPPAVERLRDLRAPVHVVCGTSDFPHVQACCAALAATWGTSVHVLEGVAHLRSIEAPDVLSGLLARLVGPLGSPGR